MKGCQVTSPPKGPRPGWCRRFEGVWSYSGPEQGQRSWLKASRNSGLRKSREWATSATAKGLWFQQKDAHPTAGAQGSQLHPLPPLPSPGSCHGSQHWQLGAGCTSPTKHCVVGILFSSATGTQLSDDCVWCSHKLPGDQTSLCENSGPNGVNVL